MFCVGYQLIKDRNKEPRVCIWRVTDGGQVYGNFMEYKEAVDCFMIEAQKGIDGDPEDTLEIIKESIIESELHDYIN